jgi:DUF2075 family protein
LNLENVHESGVSALVTLAKRERNAEAPNELLQKVTQAYRILLTRALNGVFVWVKDEQTRKHLEESLC